MRHPVSTSFLQCLDGAEVKFGVVGLAVRPCTPDHPQPGASEDANGMRMVAATLTRSCVDVARPEAGMAGGVGPGGGGAGQGEGAGPAEIHPNPRCRLGSPIA